MSGIHESAFGVYDSNVNKYRASLEKLSENRSPQERIQELTQEQNEFQSALNDETKTQAEVREKYNLSEPEVKDYLKKSSQFILATLSKLAANKVALDLLNKSNGNYQSFIPKRMNQILETKGNYQAVIPPKFASNAVAQVVNSQYQKFIRVGDSKSQYQEFIKREPITQYQQIPARPEEPINRGRAKPTDQYQKMPTSLNSPNIRDNLSNTSRTKSAQQYQRIPDSKSYLNNASNTRPNFAGNKAAQVAGTPPNELAKLKELMKNKEKIEDFLPSSKYNKLSNEGKIRYLSDTIDVINQLKKNSGIAGNAIGLSLNIKLTNLLKKCNISSTTRFSLDKAPKDWTTKDIKEIKSLILKELKTITDSSKKIDYLRNELKILRASNSEVSNTEIGHEISKLGDKIAAEITRLEKRQKKS